jgi:hypothetical protein
MVAAANAVATSFPPISIHVKNVCTAGFKTSWKEVNDMTTYQILCLVGIPSILSAVIGFMVARLKTTGKEIKAVKTGLQAVLRDRLEQAYNCAVAVGYATYRDRENWENMYQQYHNLGSNGVMDDVRTKYFALPLQLDTEDEEK